MPAPASRLKQRPPRPDARYDVRISLSSRIRIEGIGIVHGGRRGEWQAVTLCPISRLQAGPAKATGTQASIRMAYRRLRGTTVPLGRRDQEPRNRPRWRCWACPAGVLPTFQLPHGLSQGQGNSPSSQGRTKGEGCVSLTRSRASLALGRASPGGYSARNGFHRGLCLPPKRASPVGRRRGIPE